MAKKITKQDLDISNLCKDVSFIKQEVEEIKKKLEADYITRQEFEPVKKFVYGLVTLVLVAVIGAMLALILK